MSRSKALVVLLTFVGLFAFSQTHDRPALTTRQEFAKANLLVSSHDVVGRSQLTHFCIRIQPDGRFHRERAISTSFAPYAEVGKLSAADMDELKHLLEDPELKGFHQDRESLPKSVTVYEGYQIFEITIVRDAQHPQDMIFVENPRANSTPPKIEVLQRHLRDFETRRSKAFQRVPANGCRANLTASDALP